MTHVCKPEPWPTTAGESWTCPECLVPFLATRLGDHDSESSREWVQRKVMDADLIGWVAAEPSFMSASFPMRATA